MNRIIDEIFSVGGPTRRTLLKSAALLMGTSILKPAASAFAADMNYSPGSTAATSKIANQMTPAAPMPKNMIGFMLRMSSSRCLSGSSSASRPSREDSICSRPAIIFDSGRPTRSTRARPGDDGGDRRADQESLD